MGGIHHDVGSYDVRIPQHTKVARIGQEGGVEQGTVAFMDCLEIAARRMIPCIERATAGTRLLPKNNEGRSKDEDDTVFSPL